MYLLTQFPREQLISNLQNGLILLLLGMGTVFVFLTLLVFVTKAMSAIVRKIAPEKKSPAVPVMETISAPSGGNDAEIAAAICAAYAKSKK